jgi:hypothetical protein
MGQHRFAEAFDLRKDFRKDLGFSFIWLVQAGTPWPMPSLKRPGNAPANVAASMAVTAG